MEELKEGWRRVKLGEVCEYISRGISPKYSENKNDFIVINQKCIRDGKLSLEQSRNHNYNLKKFTDEKKLKKYDILINSTGVGTLGRVCQNLLSKENLTVDSHVTIVRPDLKKINPHFLGYSIKNKQKFIENLGEGSTGQTELKKQLLSEKVEINYPENIEIQEKIAKILSDLDDKIEINNEMNKTFEEMAQTLFKRWFIDFEFPNENGEPYKSSGGKMVESGLGMIPDGWRIGTLEDVINKIIDNRGKTPPRKDGGIPLIEGNNIFLTETNPILNSKQKYVSEEIYNSWFRSGHPEYLDILCATVGTLPKWCFTPKDIKICIAQNIIAIRSNNLVSPYYLKMYLDTENFIKRFEGRIITTAQPSIKVGHLTSLSIVIPIKKVVDNFDKIIKNIFEKKEINQKEIKSLTEIRDTLLPKLMSGEIEV